MPQTAQQYFDDATAQIKNLPQVAAAVKSPADLPAATKAAGLMPYLFNFGLATTVTSTVGTGVHVPVQIDPNGGGRKSLYDLAVGEEVLAGAYIVNGQAYYRYVKRDSGATPTAADGDQFTQRVTKIDGTPAGASTTGSLTILDPARGIGMLTPAAVGAVASPEKAVAVWILWSCIHITP